METTIDEDVKQMPVNQLKDIVINRNLYGGKTILAARKELEHRGIVLSESELKQKEKVKKEIIENAKKNSSGLKDYYRSFSDNIVTDKSAPQLYTRKTILIFSSLFFLLFGAITLSMNLYKLKKYKYIWLVLFYSIMFTGILIYLKGELNMKFSTFGSNLLGYAPIEFIVWKKLIGNTKYRKRDSTFPFIIGIILTALMIWATLQYR